MADSPLTPPTVIPPALGPLQESFDYNAVEAELKAAAMEVFEAMIRPRMARINTYGIPWRGDFATVERFVKAEGLALERRTDKEAFMRELYRGWRANNPRRGTAFLRYYLQLLWPGEWVLNQLWHTPADTYPQGASSSQGTGRILTSRLQLGLILSDPSNVEPVVASLRAVLAARFVLELTVLQRIGTGTIRMAAAMVAGETQAFNWVALPPEGAGTPPAAPSGVTAGSITNVGATIAWADNSGNETGFRVQLETPNGSGTWALATGPGNPTPANATSFAATGLTGATTYRARVRSESAAGVSDWAYSAPFTTAAAPSDPLWANVVLLVPMSGTAGSTTFADVSSSPRTLTPAGDVQVAAGGLAAQFDGAGDQITVTYGAPLLLGTQDWCIEGFITDTDAVRGGSGVFRGIIGNGLGGTQFDISRTTSGMLRAYIAGGTSNINSTAIPVNTETHFAVTRAGNVYRLFINGTQVMSETVPGINLSATDNWVIGGNAIQSHWQGRMRGLRVTRGNARYTSNFTPPTPPLPTA